jgi:ArsR family transcriptional regulator
MDKIIKSFSNITRVKILVCLSSKERNVTGMIKNCGLSQSAVSQHLKVLKDTGLIECKSRGREKFYKLKHNEAGDISKNIIKLITKKIKQ